MNASAEAVPARSGAAATVVSVSVLVAIWLFMMATGTGSLDQAMLEFLYSADRPTLRALAVGATIAGSLIPVVAASIAIGLWLALRRRFAEGLLLLGITLGGRGMIELQKVAFGRNRPDELEQLAPVYSLSFPSGHSANSMILLLATALIVVPARYRSPAVAVALLGTFWVGISRPMLGVHWPSDVVGGWSFGAAWVIGLVALARRRGLLT